jgi:hypothetical protein
MEGPSWVRGRDLSPAEPFAVLGRKQARREWPCERIGRNCRISPSQGIRRRWRYLLGGVTRDEWERESVGAVASGSGGLQPRYRPHVVKGLTEPVAVGPS